MWIGEPNAAGGTAAATTTPAATPTPAVVVAPVVPVVATPAVAQPAVDAAAPAVGVAAPDVAAVAAQAAAAQAAVVAAATERTAIDTLGSQYGFQPTDMATFSSVAEARTAIHNYLASLAVSQQQPATPQPVVQVAPTATVATSTLPSLLDLKALGLEADEPAAKALQIMEQQLLAMKADNDAVKQQFSDQATAQKAATRQALVHKVEATVSGFQSPLYGVTGRRSVFQQQQLQQLINIADGLAVLAYDQGRPISPVEERLASARDILENPTNRPTVPTPTAVVPALPNTTLAPPLGVEKLSLYERWSDNPALLQAVSK